MTTPRWFFVGARRTARAPLLGLALASACAGSAGGPPSATDGARTADAGRRAGPPVIACDAPVYDFGKLPQGAEVAHVFALRNRGREVLRLERAQGG